jgi:hypothetical protein
VNRVGNLTEAGGQAAGDVGDTSLTWGRRSASRRCGTRHEQDRDKRRGSAGWCRRHCGHDGRRRPMVGPRLELGTGCCGLLGTACGCRRSAPCRRRGATNPEGSSRWSPGTSCTAWCWARGCAGRVRHAMNRVLPRTDRNRSLTDRTGTLYRAIGQVVVVSQARCQAGCLAAAPTRCGCVSSRRSSTSSRTSTTGI